jgi:hypothetical protein
MSIVNMVVVGKAVVAEFDYTITLHRRVASREKLEPQEVYMKPTVVSHSQTDAREHVQFSGRYVNTPSKPCKPISTILNITGCYRPISNLKRFECDAGEPAVSGRTTYMGFKQLNFSPRLLFHRHCAHHPFFQKWFIDLPYFVYAGSPTVPPAQALQQPKAILENSSQSNPIYELK